MKYKNNSRVTKTFYGVTFKPGETKDVNGYINDPNFIRIIDTVVRKSATTSGSTAKTTTKTDSKAEVKTNG